MDRSTVDRLVVEHLPAMLRFAMRLTGDANIAEEVVQEALCQVLRRWRGFRADASFRTWLFRIVINIDRDRRRRRELLPMANEIVAANDVEPIEQVVAGELQGRIRLAIDQLPARQREVAILCLGEGLAAPEVALVLDTTEANVHTCLHLARKRIAKAVGYDYMNREMT